MRYLSLRSNLLNILYKPRNFFRCYSSDTISRSANYFSNFEIEPNKANGLKFRLTHNGVPIKSHSGLPIEIPTKEVGEILLAEWRKDLSFQQEKPSPVTSLVYRAIDLYHDVKLREQLIHDLASYLHTDSLCFLESSDNEVRRAQENTWIPIIKNVEAHLKLDPLVISETIKPINQSPRNIDIIVNVLRREFSSYALAGFEHLTRSLKSVVLPFAFFYEHIDEDGAIKAAMLEQIVQCEKWGTIVDHHDLNTAVIKRSIYLGSLFLSCNDNKI